MTAVNSHRLGIHPVKWWPACRLVLLILAATMSVGCQTARYYRQAIAGQIEIFSRQRSIERLLADPATGAPLRERLELVTRIREFAATEMGLTRDGHYRRYADLGRKYVVWNVYAAPEFSLEPRQWWYPVVGKLKYQGYFSEAAARRYAARLEAEGFDVYVGGIQAYSTLGWFQDPVLNTFIFDNETELVELLLHEMAHQRLFVRGDTDFNEAFATAVAEEGLRRWMLAHGDAGQVTAYRVAKTRRLQFVALVSGARERLDSLYATTAMTEGRAGSPAHEPAPPSKAAEKQRVFLELRQDYEQLKTRWGGYDGYDAWFQESLNNAKLNTVETYYRLVPAFRALLQQHDGDLPEFYRAVEDLGKLPSEAREVTLMTLHGNSAEARALGDPVHDSPLESSPVSWPARSEK